MFTTGNAVSSAPQHLQFPFYSQIEKMATVLIGRNAEWLFSNSQNQDFQDVRIFKI